MDQVFIGGLAADACVYFTVLDSLKEGFKSTLIEDATKAISDKDFANAKEDIQSRQGKIITGKN